MINHPEQQPNEKYLGNTHHLTPPPHLKHIPSLRYGKVAYDWNDKPLSDVEQTFNHPMFIAKNEYYLYDEAIGRCLCQRTTRG